MILDELWSPNAMETPWSVRLELPRVERGGTIYCNPIPNHIRGKLILLWFNFGLDVFTEIEVDTMIWHHERTVKAPWRIGVPSWFNANNFVMLRHFFFFSVL